MSVPYHHIDYDDDGGEPPYHGVMGEVMQGLESDVPMLPTTPYTIGIDPGNSDVTVTMQPPAEHISLGDIITVHGREGTLTSVEELANGDVVYTTRSVQMEYTPITISFGAFGESRTTPSLTRRSWHQIMEIFNAHWPIEENAYRWWSIDSEILGGMPTSHEKRTRYYLGKYPWWKLWKINKKLEEEKLTPTIDHPRSDIVIGKSKAAGAYYQHNQNFKRFIKELLP